MKNGSRNKVGRTLDLESVNQGINPVLRSFPYIRCLPKNTWRSGTYAQPVGTRYNVVEAGGAGSGWVEGAARGTFVIVSTKKI